MEYQLSASLQAHEDDVRDVAFADESAVLSASRDGTVRLWKRDTSSPPVFDESIAYNGSAFVNAVTYLPPSPTYPDGLVVSGGKDAIIDVRQPGRPPDSNAERMLLGHQGNVCSLDVSPDPNMPYLVSGSWDATARLWDVDKGETTVTLQGHDGSVWSVLAYDAKTIITGCADKLIRIFGTSGKLQKTLKGSTDVVRALCRIPQQADSPAQFASSGNDSIIRLWTLQGIEVTQLHGHENFVYSLACLPDGTLLSSSEDRTVRVWSRGDCVQTITHPAISVWSVSACPVTGDIVTGASDRMVRVFTKETARIAAPDAIQQFHDSVKGSSIPKQQMPDINKEKLPGPEFLQQKSGTKEGQVQMIREQNGNVSAHQWSASANRWINVGTVVDAVGSSGRRQEFQGKDYDYVFDVDIEDGKPALKLPYNLSENPYEVAQKFIGDNELPISYLDQVANFIVTNTQGATIGQSNDPARSGGDAWGTESRYRPGDANESAAAAPSAPKPKIIPQKDYLLITTATFSMMTKKITELSGKFASEGRKDLSFSPGELQALADLGPELEAALASKPVSATPSISNGINVAVKIATQWPPEARIPGLDLLRCLCAATPAVTEASSAQGGDLISVLEPLFSAWQEVPAQNYVNTVMLAIRSFANLFAHPEGRTLCAVQFSTIWGFIKPSLCSSGTSYTPTTGKGKGAPIQVTWNRNVHIAAMTLAIDYAILFILSAIAPEDESPISTSANQEHAALVAYDLVTFLEDSKVIDSETVYRALVALGTLLIEPELMVSELPGLEEDAAKVLTRIEKTAKEPRIKTAVSEIRALLA